MKLKHIINRRIDNYGDITQLDDRPDSLLKRFRVRSVALVLLLGLQLMATSAHGKVIQLTIENLAPSEGTLLTPFWVGFHDGSFDFVDHGSPASMAVESFAEDGAFDALSEEFKNAAFHGYQTVITGPQNPGGPPLFFQDSKRIQRLVIDKESQQYFSFAAMVLPSNDAFVANDDARGYPLFDTDGNFINQTFVITGQQVYDAGTEVNDEVAANVPVLGQAAPNTGTTEGGVVAMHPGFAESGPILGAFPGANFTADGYYAVRITIEEVPENWVTLDIKVESTAPEEGHLLTPFWLALHDGGFDIANGGEPASTGVEMAAEDGDFSGVQSEFEASMSGLVSGILTGPENPDGPPLFFQKNENTWRLTVDANHPDNRYLSYIAMVLPSNDAFITNDDPTALPLFDEYGRLLDVNWTIPGNMVYDAGTEVNDETPAHVPVLGQSSPNTGVSENGVVAMHPGFNMGGEVLSAFPAADFKQEGYSIARITVERVIPHRKTVSITIDNPAPLNGTILTPFWLALHDGSFDIANNGESASSALEMLAEDGDSSGLSYAFANSGAGDISGVLTGPDNPGGPPLFFQQTMNTWEVTLDVNSQRNRYLSFAAMILPSNDAFITNVNPTMFEIIDDLGGIEQHISVPGSMVYDAGTEVNDERPINVPVLGQVAPNTGTTEDGVVMMHPGFLEGGDVLSAFPAADFTQDGYSVANIHIAEVPTRQVTIEVSVRNLASTDGTLLTPFWLGLHDGGFHLFSEGFPANSAVEMMAEDGDFSGVQTHFAGSGTGTHQGVLKGPFNGDGPPLFFQGTENRWTVTVDSLDPQNQYLSYAAMVLPSNDAFVGNDIGWAHKVIDDSGNIIPQSILVTGAQVWDAGTEVNDEIAENVPVLGQAAPNTGTTEKGIILPHSGFVTDGPILTQFPAADFTFPGYYVAEIKIRELDNPFSGYTADVDGFKDIPKFGELRDALFPFVYHKTHGWLYVVSAGEFGFWAYNYEDNLGWLFVNLWIWPTLYINSYSEWFEYVDGTDSPREFLRYSDGEALPFP